MLGSRRRAQDAEAQSDFLKVIGPEDIVIAIFGTTGAGKSSFIGSCTKNNPPHVGHGLLSCTTQVSVHTMQLLERTVHLIDTPGFNDTVRSDAETFQELAYWLAAADDKNLRLSGVIFLHRITDIRFHSSSRQALEVFKAICGEDAFCGAVVATTMWDRVATKEIDKAQDRQAQLKNKIQDDILAFGGRLVSISAAEVDPYNIVRHIVRKDLRLNLAFQREFKSGNCLLHQTRAGKIVYESLLVPLEAMKGSMDPGEMAVELASLRATRAEAQVAWEMRIAQENEDFERLVRRYRDCSRSKDCTPDTSFSAPSAIASISLSEPSLSCTTDRSDTSSVSYSTLESNYERLKRQYEAVMLRLPHKLDQRKWSNGRGTTTLGVVGTGLAVGQLVAAVACNVM